MRRLLVFITVLTLFAAGCGDDDLLSDGGTEAPSDTQAAPTSQTPVTTQAAPTTEAGGGAGTGAASEIEALLEQYQTVPLRVTYRFDDGSGDESLMTMSQDPTREPPVSAVLIGAEGSEGRFISIGDQSIVCDPTSGGCFEIPGGGDMGSMLLGPMMSGFLFATRGLVDSPGFTAGQNDIQVAGRSGMCFTYDPTQFDPTADVDEVRQCIDSELGFILLIETAEPGQESRSLMELVEFGQPQPEDFEPTGPLQEMGG
jgi:hypothetical protein